MATFWAGTVPIMAALTLGFDKISHNLQRQIPAMMASLVIFVGVFTIAHRAPIAVANDHFEVVQGSSNLVEQINQIEHEKLPCCCNQTNDR